MNKSLYKKVVSTVCIVLYCTVACWHPALQGINDNNSAVSCELVYSATEADFSLHTFQPSSSQNIIKTSGSVSVPEKNPFKYLFLQEDALQVSGKNLTRYFQLCRNLVIRFSPVEIIFPFHSFW
ncbi:MAG: hypothetical protein KIT62_04700 [Cyclobacteriaceae bacterium]|nr:hypothetical protein [Cyclobacteriaceae bacterium]